MTPEHEQLIQARLSAATEGPWSVDGPAQCGPGDTLTVYPVEDGGALAYVQPSWDDAEFIAKAPTYIPALLAEVDRLRGQLADAWDEGFDAGERDAFSHQTFDEPCIPNPYRKDQS